MPFRNTHICNIAQFNFLPQLPSRRERRETLEDALLEDLVVFRETGNEDAGEVDHFIRRQLGESLDLKVFVLINEVLSGQELLEGGFGKGRLETLSSMWFLLFLLFLL